MAKTMKQTKTGMSGLSVDKMTHDVSQVGVGVITVMAALIGIWGIACLFGGIAQSGVGELISGYITAVTGR